jgi:hypothetical protein
MSPPMDTPGNKSIKKDVPPDSHRLRQFWQFYRMREMRSYTLSTFRSITSLLVLLILPLPAEVSVPTAQNNLTRTGANTAENILNPTTILAGFGKLHACAISGDTQAQVLYHSALTIDGEIHQVAIVATMANIVYAFDVNTCQQLWTTGELGTPWTNYGTCCSGNMTYYGAAMGIVGTPVIDPDALKLYVVHTTNTPTHVLDRIDLTTGEVEDSVVISGSSGGVTFATADAAQSTALALSADGSKVYFGFSGWENGHSPDHGWLFAYNTSTLTRIAAFCTTPGGTYGNIWMSRAAPAIDEDGNVYVVTGNGDYNGSTQFGQSTLKFDASLTLLDWFTPENYSAMNAVDADFGSGRVLLIEGTDLLVVAGKDFQAFVLDRTCMGHLQDSDVCSYQVFETNEAGTPAAFTGSFGSLFMNNMLYLPITTGPLYAFSYSSGTFNSTPVFTTATSFGGHNGQISGSANGSSNGLIWVTTSASSTFTTKRAGTLRALRATDGVELWNSGTNSARDALGSLSKFTNPTIADGKVLVPNQSSQLVVYGLLPSVQTHGQVTIKGAVTIQ